MIVLRRLKMDIPKEITALSHFKLVEQAHCYVTKEISCHCAFEAMVRAGGIDETHAYHSVDEHFLPL